MVVSNPLRYDLDTLANLYQFYQQNFTNEMDQKIYDLIKKKEEERFTICFAGHFSAGKSTLINQFTNEPLLPQSPIPTSANVVEIVNGKEEIIVDLKNQQAVRSEASLTIDQIQNLCKDGETINRIRISKPLSQLPENVSIFDTPGIDSVDDADRIITEASIHTADILYYVVDYNHVQSEVNAMFLKEIEHRGIPYCLIVNQIDKHVDSELTFEAFKNSTENALLSWELHPQKVYYISLKALDLPTNEWKELKADMHQLFSPEQTNMINDTINREVSYYIDLAMDEYNESLIELENANENEDKSETGESIGQLKENLSTLEESVTSLDDQVNTLLNQTTANAQLMSFEIREKARELLESFQDNFKTGIFTTSKKREKIREERLQHFYGALMEQVEANLIWKLRDKLTAFINQYYKETLTLELPKEPYQKEAVIKQINTGASVTGEYVLNYTKQLEQDIKKHYRLEYKAIWLNYKKEIEELIQKDISKLQQSLNEATTQYKDKEKQETRISEINKYQEYLKAFKHGEVELDRDIYQKLKHLNKVEVKTDHTYFEEKSIYHKNDDQEVSSPLKERESLNLDPKTTLNYAKKVVDITRDLDSVQKLTTTLEEKIERLEKQKYEIALFGAFSAGKSSFANALLGENILPVSPNPTTATINKISPPTKTHKHRTAIVKMKSEEDVLDDIHLSLSDITFDSLKSFIDWFQRKKWKKMNLSTRNFTFLKAISDGYQDVSAMLSEKQEVTQENFERFIATESIACFVEELELFFDCAITRKGISLVDTPGADSINARHTNLTFSYMKNSDAILFLTYYNHPFSKADELLLQQLGKIKDAFHLDKMFFIINAADLASDEEELSLVKQYVKNQLQKNEVYQPNLYALSSKNVMLDKSREEAVADGGFLSFEHDFDYFLGDQLLQLSLSAMITDVERIEAFLKRYIDAQNMEAQEKENLKGKYEQELTEYKAITANYPIENSITYILEQLEKQFYYMKQRLSIQFPDHFKEFFHPGRIKLSGKKGRLQVQESYEAFIKQLNQLANQELRAIIVRMETWSNDQFRKVHQDLADKFYQLSDEEYQISAFHSKDLDQPDWNEQVFHIQENKVNSVLNQYKDTKQFFQENKKKIMEENLSDILLPFYEDKLKNINDDFHDFYKHQIEELIKNILADVQTQAEYDYDSFIDKIFNQTTDEKMIDAYEEMKRIK
ncbi:dynamin family protein [Saliterribacillus persicus]|uniref:Small GTP-binding protein n=1 Tax=Saliterribacillus persicus TaxID=930114 RepID=A0A368XCL3_9BACI|nr:dynamin family protein [Saliterribacillus persicus]RCW63774.1 small GTP-binding protein [Saliterribacillus persicus]